MRRLQPNTCGYDGFVCKPLSKLKTLYKTTPVTICKTEDPTDRADWVWPDNIASVDQATVDNYAQIPRVLEGFVMTLDPIEDMKASMEVPEIACRTNLDPFSVGVTSVLNPEGPAYTVNHETINTGFVDLYNQVAVYKRKVYDYVGDAVDGTGRRIKLVLGSVIKPTIVVDANDKITQTLTVGPGLLEPMLDTDFSYTPIDTITGPDALGDFTVWLFDEFNQWKNIIDDKISKINVGHASMDYSGINALFNLKAADELESECPNFRIHRTGGGAPLQEIRHGRYTWPEYEIDTGTVYIDGEAVTVSESAIGLEQDFDVYLDIRPKGLNGAASTTAVLLTVMKDSLEPLGNRVDGHYYVFVGCVTAVFSEDATVFDVGKNMVEFKITQGDCITDITLNPDGTCDTEYNGPFKVIADETAHSAPAIWLDKYDGCVSISGPCYTGKLFVDGVLMDDVETQTVQVAAASSLTEVESETDPETGVIHTTYRAIGGADVYAHVTYTPGDETTAASVAVSFDDSDTVAPPVLAEGEEDPNKYFNIRLARVTGIAVTGTTVPQVSADPIITYETTVGDIEQIHYGDLYVYTKGSTASGGGATGPYDGPFRVSAESLSDTQTAVKVHGIHYDYDLSTTTIKYAGRVVLDGGSSHEVQEAWVQTPQTNSQQQVTYVAPTSGNAASSTYPTGIFDVYAMITLQEQDETYAYSSCDFIARSASGASASVTASGGSVQYWVRLARCSSSSSGEITVEQTHFGDIYIDLQKIKASVAPVAESDYNGPFKLKFDANNNTIEIDGPAEDTIDGTAYPGRLYRDGQFVAMATPASTIPQGVVFAHISYPDSAHLGSYSVTYNNTESYTPAAGSLGYTVRLGKVSATNKATIPIPVDGVTYDVDVSTLVAGAGTTRVVRAISTPPGYAVSQPTAGVTGTTVTLNLSTAEYTEGSTSARKPISATILYNGSSTTVSLLDVAVDQYHTGDIYIDTDEAAAGYEGPFRVYQDGTSNSVKLYAFDDSTTTPNVVGKIILGSTVTDTQGQATTTHTATSGLSDVTWTTSFSASAGTIIYAHIYLKKGTPTATSQPYVIDSYEFNTTETPSIAATANNATTDTPSKVFTYRIAKIGSIDTKTETIPAQGNTPASTSTSYAIKVIQIQHGDIYLGDVSDPIEQEHGDTYAGPFHVKRLADGHVVIENNCDCITTDNCFAGQIVINGSTGTPVKGGSVEISSADSTANKYVYAHVTGTGSVRYDTSPTYTGTPPAYTVRLAAIGGATRDQQSTSVPDGESTRTVYYGTVGEDAISQYHYGDIYVDGRWM